MFEKQFYRSYVDINEENYLKPSRKNAQNLSNICKGVDKNNVRQIHFELWRMYINLNDEWNYCFQNKIFHKISQNSQQLL